MAIKQYNVKFYKELTRHHNCLVIFCDDTWRWERDYNGKINYYGVTGTAYEDSTHLGHGTCKGDYITNSCCTVTPIDVALCHPFLLQSMTQLYGTLTEMRKDRWAYIQEVENEFA